MCVRRSARAEVIRVFVNYLRSAAFTPPDGASAIHGRERQRNRGNPYHLQADGGTQQRAPCTASTSRSTSLEANASLRRLALYDG